jgi:hypothetical protein
MSFLKVTAFVLLECASAFLSTSYLPQGYPKNKAIGTSVFRSVSALSLRGGSVKMSAAAEPKTGTQTVKREVRDEALSKFFEGPATCTPTSGGVNNMVNYVETAKGEKYILRIYNNGKNSARVKFEHEVLRQLGQQKLSFEIPRTLPSLGDKKSHVLLSNGAEACVFYVIPGALPKTTSPRSTFNFHLLVAMMTVPTAPLKSDEGFPS